MKTNKFRSADKLFLVLVAGIFSMSCSNDEGGTAASEFYEKPLVLYSKYEQQNETKSTVYNSWTGGEEVQVSLNGGEALAFVSDRGGKLTPKVPLYWKAANEVINVKAWYPAAFTMLKDQSIERNYQAADFIMASDNITYQQQGTKFITFQHRTSKIVVNLIKGRGVEDLSNVSVSLFGYGTGSVDERGNLKGSGANIEILPFKASEQYIYRALVIPQDMTDKTFIKVASNGKDYYFRPDNEEGLLTPGRTHIYNATLTDSGLEVDFVSTIENWSDDNYDIHGGVVLEDYLQVILDSNFKSLLLTSYDINSDGKLSYEEVMAVKEITVSGPDITSLEGVRHFKMLEKLTCTAGAGIASLNVSGLTSLKELECAGNNLSSLNINGCVSLSGLYCSDNKISELDLRTSTGLKVVDCSNNKLTKLNITGLTGLNSLKCDNNEISSLTIGKSPELKELSCRNNRIVSLDLTGCQKLETLNCAANDLKELNIGYCRNLNTLNCEGNENLATIHVWQGFNMSNPGAEIPGGLYFDNGSQIRFVELSAPVFGGGPIKPYN